MPSLHLPEKIIDFQYDPLRNVENSIVFNSFCCLELLNNAGVTYPDPKAEETWKWMEIFEYQSTNPTFIINHSVRSFRAQFFLFFFSSQFLMEFGFFVTLVLLSWGLKDT